MELGDGLYLFQFKLGWILGGCYLAATDFDSVPSLLVGTIGVAPTGIKPSTHMFSIVDSSIVDKRNLDIFWNLSPLELLTHH